MKRIIKFSILTLVCILSINASAQQNRYRYLSHVFPSDSLRGFDEIQASQNAMQRGFFGLEYKVFMYSAKRNYINQKYGYGPPPSFDAGAKGPGGAVITATPCNNEDFEASPVGNVNAVAGWTLSAGQNNGSNGSCTMAGCCPTNPATSTSGSDFWIVATPSTDPVIGTIPNSPLGGSRVLKINDNITNQGEIGRIEQTFPVTTSNALFRFAYMAGMDGTGHLCCDQPFMKIVVLNCSNTPLACPSISITAPGASCASAVPAGWTTNSSGYSYTPAWQLSAIDLTPYIGSCVTIQVTVGDCDGWAHFGYAYFDATCAPMNVTVNNISFPIGTGASGVSACAATATIVAPPGTGPYTWNGPAGSGISGNTSQTITTTVGGNYTLTMNPLGSCAPITRTINLTFTSPPIAGFQYSNLCTAYTLTNTGSAAPAVQTYSFAGTGAPAGYTTTSTTSNVTFPSAGTYTIFQVVTSGSCTATSSSVVVVPTGPNPAFTTPTYTQCLTGNSFVFTAADPSGTHAYSFNPAGPAPGATATYGPVNFTSAGTYTVTHSISSGGCANQTTSVVVINPQPVPVANNNGPLCTGATITLTAGGGTGYQWTGPNSFSSGLQNPTIGPAAVTDGGVYTVTVTALGCSEVASTTVIVTTPTAAATNSGPYCAGFPINLNTTSPGTSYTWNGPLGYSGSGASPSIPNSTTGMSGVYTVTVSFSGGCTATATTGVLVNPIPNPTINSNSPICIGQDINFVGGGVGTYSWTGPSGYNNTAQSPTITSAALSNSGTYTLTITDANGCVNFTTSPVTVNPQPNVVATGTSVCENANAPLSSSGGVFYSWSGPGGYTSSAQNPVITGATFGSAGQYTVLVTDANTCTNTAVANLVVTPGVTPAISCNSPVCQNDLLIFTAGGGVSYSWSGPNGFVTTANNPSVVATSLAMNGTYFVTVTDANGCFASTSINATVNPLPVASISAGNNRGCPPLCVTFTAQSSPALANASWAFGNGTFANGTNPAESCFMTTGIYSITSTITDVNGCPGSATYTAEVYPQPVADFNHAPIKPIINIDADVNFTDASHSASITAWNWYFMNTPQYTSTQQNPTFMYDEPGDYVVALVVKSDKGCTDTLIKKITVGEDFGIYVPNSFTPNNDGLNDIFQPKGFGIVKYNLQVFDRWGEKIFESSEFDKGWDGIYQGRGGKICQEGTYVWKIKVTSVFSKAHEYTGHVTLIK